MPFLYAFLFVPSYEQIIFVVGNPSGIL
jgi:hypothetical protein